MNRKTMGLFVALFVGMSLSTVQAQISTRQQQDEQDAIDAKTPKLNYKEDVLQLLVPGYTMGEHLAERHQGHHHAIGRS